mgnify:CR=1 FL=1
MSKHKNGTKAAFIDKNAQNATEKSQNTTEKSILSGKNEKNDEKPQNATEKAEETTAKSFLRDKSEKNDEKSQNAAEKAEETTRNEFSDEKDVKIDENGQNPTCSCGGIEAENLALRAEIAGLRGELDALRTREGELVRELGERGVPDYAAIAADESFADEYACRSEIIKAKVITDYLRSLSHTGGVRLLGEKVGRSALAPLTKPKTLSEAKKLAELYIKD